MADQERYDIFLSYSSADTTAADKVVQALEDAGLTVFRASKDLRPGDDFSDRIRQALANATEICLLVTPSSLKSAWVTTEWGAAWAFGKTIVPVLYRVAPEQLPDRLQQKHCLDLDDVRTYAAQAAQRMRHRADDEAPPHTGLSTSEVLEIAFDVSISPRTPRRGETSRCWLLPNRNLPNATAVVCRIWHLGWSTERHLVSSVYTDVQHAAGVYIEFTPDESGEHEALWIRAVDGAELAKQTFEVTY